MDFMTRIQLLLLSEWFLWYINPQIRFAASVKVLREKIIDRELTVPCDLRDLLP
jgi:hypothetical protein